MKVRELIAELQKLDPTGELNVFTVRGDCDELYECGVNELWVADGDSPYSYSYDKTDRCPVRAIEV